MVVSQRVGVINCCIIAPGDSTELIPVLKKAQDAGIVIINIDNRLNPTRLAQIGLKDGPFISVDHAKGAYLSAQFISNRIKTPTQAVIWEGICTAQNAIDRKQCALQAFRENPNITVTATQTANWQIDEAYHGKKTLSTENPQIGAMFCTNDTMPLGSLKYLAETNRTDILVANFYMLNEAN